MVRVCKLELANRKVIVKINEKRLAFFDLDSSMLEFAACRG